MPSCFTRLAFCTSGLLLLVLAIGCGDKQRTEPKEPVSTQADETKPSTSELSKGTDEAPDIPKNTSEQSINDGPLPANMGTIRGRILLSPDSELPKVAREAYWGGKQAPNSEKCSPPKLEDYTPVKMVKDRALAGLMVSATGDPKTFLKSVPNIEAQNRFVSIEDCRMKPRLIVATRGDYVHLTNHTKAPFVPTFGPSPFNAALLPTQTKSWQTKRGGVSEVACKFGMSCGKTDVVVVYHPVHTISKADGTFELRVPSDQEIEIHAWHPLFSDVGKKLTVKSGETLEVTMSISAKPAAPSQEEPTPPTKAAPTEKEATE